MKMVVMNEDVEATIVQVLVSKHTDVKCTGQKSVQ